MEKLGLTDGWGHAKCYGCFGTQCVLSYRTKHTFLIHARNHTATWYLSKELKTYKKNYRYIINLETMKMSLCR